MATIPLWLIGRTVTAVIATPLIPDGDGLLSAAAMGAQSFTGVADEISYQGSVTTQEISALTSSRRNAVVIEQDDTMVITEVMRSAAGQNLGAAIWVAADAPPQALFQFSRGGNQVALYGTLTRYEEDVQRGKSVARLTIRIVDTPGTGNPALGAAFAG
jgi:hypothetical protein